MLAQDCAAKQQLRSWVCVKAFFVNRTSRAGVNKSKA
jgi:hypothetical protein